MGSSPVLCILLGRTDFRPYCSTSQMQPANWPITHLHILHTLPDRLTSLPTLFIPWLHGICTVDIEACDSQLGRIQLQKQHDEHHKLIRFLSKALTDADSDWDITHRECVAVVWAVLFLFSNLLGTHSTLKTYNEAPSRVLKLADATASSPDGYFGYCIWSLTSFFLS